MNGIIPCVVYKGSAISYGPRGFDHSAGLLSEDTGVLVTAKLMKCCKDRHTHSFQMTQVTEEIISAPP